MLNNSISNPHINYKKYNFIPEVKFEKRFLFEFTSEIWSISPFNVSIYSTEWKILSKNYIGIYMNIFSCNK